MKLRPYQSRCVEAALEEARQTISPCLIDAAPAAGKSFMIAAIAARLHEISGGKRVLCLAPSAELVKQNHAKFLLTGEMASIFSASAGFKSTARVVVFGTPGTVKNAISRFTRQGSDGFCAVIVDECFPAGTMIETPRGEVPIESLRNGDIVCNTVGSGNVETVFTKSVSEIYSVRLSSGKTIECTGGHPFFTERGWITANSLLEGEVAFCREDVSRLLSYFYTQNGSAKEQAKTERPIGAFMEQARDLFAILRKEMAESHAQRFVSTEDEGSTQTDRTQATSDLGERVRSNCSSTSIAGHIGGRLDCRAPDSDKGGAQKRGVSERIQGGLGEPRKNDSDRSGRGESRDTCTASGGQEKRCAFGSIRVESVSRTECESPRIVYNLHVSGHPSYFAGGVLVHNCHGITPTIKAIIDAMRVANPRLRVIGLSGTPYRLGRGYIFRVWPDGSTNGDNKCRDPYFARCVYRVGAQEMLDDGFITPMRIGSIGSQSYETEGIHMLPNGQPNPDDIERAFVGHGRKTASIVADVVDRAREMPGGVMLFAATVRHSEEIMASLPPANSRLVTGDTPRQERAKIITDYRSQAFRYIVSVETLATGFDVEHTGTIALLRYTESAALLQQIMGRAWRLHPDKAESLLLDYADNVDRHFPDGDIYQPVIKATGGGGCGEIVPAQCPDCGHGNEFTAHKDYIDFKKDAHGHCMDAFGEVLQSEWGPVPGHYGRRCWGQLRGGPAGEYVRCGYYWTSKPCPACEAPNDIAARYCRECKAEIIDPNEKLAIEFKTMKRDPYHPQTDDVLSMEAKEGVSQRGNKTMRIDFVTPYRQFSVWLQPEGTHSRARAEWAKYLAATTEETPATVSYVKDRESGFFRVLAYNHLVDELEKAA